MTQQTNQNPLLDLAQAIGDIDCAMDDCERLELDLTTARLKLAGVKRVAQQSFGSAQLAARALGQEIPYNYQRCDTLIRFDEEPHQVEVERIKIGYAQDLRDLIGAKPGASS